MKNTQYITIQGWMVNELKLKGNDLIVYAVIYGFSQDGDSKFTGSIDYLCNTINGTRPTVRKALKNLTNRNLLIKEIIKGSFNVYKADLEGVKNLSFASKETLPDASKETLPNNTIINTIENRKADFKKSLHPFLEKYGKNILNDFYSYWTEKSAKGKKMRFEGEKFFDLSRRLNTWHKRNNSNNNSAPVEEFDATNYES